MREIAGVELIPIAHAMGKIIDQSADILRRRDPGTAQFRRIRVVQKAADADFLHLIRTAGNGGE